MWRWIGRLAFPLFAFMISQGVIYTRNHKRYLLTLLVTTIIAEPAYDLALYGSIVHTAHQSVMVTLLLGLRRTNSYSLPAGIVATSDKTAMQYFHCDQRGCASICASG